jgi:hypothetical protein
VTDINQDTGRYTVDFSSEGKENEGDDESDAKKMALKPANLMQLVSGVRIAGIQTRQELNSLVADVVGYDACSGRYALRVRNSTHLGVETLSLRPANVILPSGCCVRVCGLRSEDAQQHNGKYGKISAFDAQAGRYVVSVSEPGATELQLRLRPENAQL